MTDIYSKDQKTNVDNLSIITGDNNNVNQSLRAIRIKPNNAPNPNEIQQSPIMKRIEQFWWAVIIPIIIGIILLGIEKSWFK